jgi:IS30 family transposase
LTSDDRLRRYVREKLQKRWSPREIVKRLQEEYPEERTMRISHETIYRYIYVLPRGALKATLIQALGQARAYRRTRKSRNELVRRGLRATLEKAPHMALNRRGGYPCGSGRAHRYSQPSGAGN